MEMWCIAIRRYISDQWRYANIPICKNGSISLFYNYKSAVSYYDGVNGKGAFEKDSNNGVTLCVPCNFEILGEIS